MARRGSWAGLRLAPAVGERGACCHPVSSDGLLVPRRGGARERPALPSPPPDSGALEHSSSVRPMSSEAAAAAAPASSTHIESSRDCDVAGPERSRRACWAVSIRSKRPDRRSARGVRSILAADAPRAGPPCFWRVPGTRGLPCPTRGAWGEQTKSTSPGQDTKNWASDRLANEAERCGRPIGLEAALLQAQRHSAVAAAAAALPGAGGGGIFCRCPPICDKVAPTDARQRAAAAPNRCATHVTCK